LKTTRGKEGKKERRKERKKRTTKKINFFRHYSAGFADSVAHTKKSLSHQ